MTQRTVFVYHNIELYKSESLGSGSYGGVCKARCDGLLCAAKIMHPTLFDLRDPGADSYLQKFQEECHLLSLARHPNVVQYLATYYDPDTQLPVLLMELCDESLTAFLERSPGPLSYHIQLNICHDIALALVYLHSNGLIHRDLTGNNVLMIAGPRAKITDFGMSKLATVNPRMTALTMCPGNVLYMSPEALDASNAYSAKLDIFSFGIIIIQILTRKFPNPTNRFRMVRVPQFKDPLRREVPETERRETHLKLIPDTHSLKPLTLHCLKKKERQRPSALELSERLSEQKQSSQYTEGLHQAQRSTTDIQQLQQQLQGLMREAMEHQTRIAKLESTIDVKNRQLQDKEITNGRLLLQVYQETISNKDRQLQETIAHNKIVVEMRENQLQEKQEQLRASEQLVSEFQQSLQQKDNIIDDLQQTISTHEEKIRLLKQHTVEEGKSQQSEQQDTAIGGLPQQQPVTSSHITTQKGINKMTWRKGKGAPEDMCRGAAVMHGNTAYFRPGNSCKVYSYKKSLGEEQWSQLPDNPNMNFGLTVIDGILTGVGGSCKDIFTNTLLSLRGEGERKRWSEVFAPMPTPRMSAACITTEQALAVAGGDAGDSLDTVEVMNFATKQWTTVSSLPQKCSQLSGVVCGDTLYLAGGYNIGYKPSEPVFACSIPDLLRPNTIGSRIRRTLSLHHTVWKEISSLPVKYSTLASFSGDLLAIGGRDDSGSPTTDVYRYDFHTNSWSVVSQTKNKRSSTFVVTLPGDRLIVVGGYSRIYGYTDSVEILE